MEVGVAAQMIGGDLRGFRVHWTVPWTVSNAVPVSSRMSSDRGASPSVRIVVGSDQAMSVWGEVEGCRLKLR